MKIDRTNESAYLQVELYRGTDEGWNTLLDYCSPIASIYHCAEWDNYQHENNPDMKGLRCVIKEPQNNRLVGVCLITVLSTPEVAYWLYGPLFIKNIKNNFIIDTIITLLDFLQNQNVRYVEPIYLPNNLLGNDQIDELREKSGCTIKEGGTFILDLEGKTPDDVWRNFDNSVRKNVKKCERAEVEVSRVEDIFTLEKDYLPILRENRQRMGFEMPPAYPNAVMWKWLHQGSNILEVFVAKQKGEPIAGLGIVGRASGVNEIAVAQSNRCHEERIPAQDYIKWEITRWCLSNGVKAYDLTGVTPNSKDEKELGIFRFKKKFGGKYFTYWVLGKQFHENTSSPRIFPRGLTDLLSAIFKPLRKM